MDLMRSTISKRRVKCALIIYPGCFRRHAMRSLSLTQDNLNIANPISGKLLYNVTSRKFYFADGTQFQRVMSMTADLLGVNTLTPTYTLDVASNTSMAMRLVASGEYANYVLADGINVESSNFNIANHNANMGLKLAGVRVTALANELNTLAGVTPGAALGNKAVVLDLNKSVSGLNTLTAAALSTSSLTATFANVTSLAASSATFAAPLAVSSGGTGVATVAKGGLLVGSTSSAFQMMQPPVASGLQLINDASTPTGLAWSSHVLTNYIAMTKPVLVTQGTYSIEHIECRSYDDTGYIALTNVNAVASLSTLLGSATLTGTAYANPATNVITGTGFLSQIKPNDSLVIDGQVRRVVTVTDDTALTVITPFTILNQWVLTGTAAMVTTQFRFGTRSLTATATTAFATVTSNPNIPTPPAWTMEFHVRFASVTAVRSVVASNVPFSIAINMKTGPVNLTISIGQGTTFNIANAVALTSTAIAANTWYHFALVFSGTTYRAFINGTLATTITSALAVPATTFQNVRVAGGVSTFNGWIDEWRLSKVARYSGTFTAPTAQFTKDANTLSLNHFEAAGITISDECSDSSNTRAYQRNTRFANDNVQVVYTYAIQDALYVSPRQTETDLVDIPSKYLEGVAPPAVRRLPVYHVADSTGLYPMDIFTTGDGGWSLFKPSITVVTNSIATTPISFFMDGYTPIDARLVRLLITHTHVGTIACGVVVGSYSEYYETYLTTATAGATSIVLDLTIFGSTMQAYLSAAAGATSFSIRCLGFLV